MILPIIPFVIPSGSPKRGNIQAILDDLSSHGIVQFLVYSSNGLDYAYLGDEFFEMMEWFASEAEARGMKMWLYDEFNWPSGTAHGRVPLENDAFRYKELIGYLDEDGKVQWRIETSYQINDDSGACDGNNLEPEGVRRFMELTHFEHEKHLGKYFGKTIVGIFTDEPGWASGARQMPIPEKTRVRFPYWSGMEEEYHALTGGDFRQEATVAIEGGHPEESRVFQSFAALRSARYRRSYFDPIAAWCKRVGLLSTGHLVGEDGGGFCSRFNGTPLRTLKGLMQPGIDMINSVTGYDFEWLTLATAQHAADRVGRPAAAELFALGPCDLSFTDLRRMYWISAMHKIGVFFTTMYHTTGRRFLRKPAWAMFYSPTQPWYKYSKELNAVAEEAAKYAAKPFICSIGVRYLAGRLGAAFLTETEELPLAELCRQLTWNQFTFDLLEEDEVSDKAVVFTWDGKTLVDEKSGTRFESLEEAVGWLEARFAARPRVLDAKGMTRKGVLTREYQDGEVVSIDVTTGELIRQCAPQKAVPADWRVVTPAWNLALDGPTRRRVWFPDNGNTSFVCQSPLDGVRFILRNYPEGQFSVTLDGMPLAFPKRATSLAYAYNEICLESEPIRLERGEHRLELQGGKDDLLFLPALWMVGDFSEPEYGVLGRPPESVVYGSLKSCGLASFAGTATYSAAVSFAPGEQFWVDAGNAVVEVKLGGNKLGVRCWAPYVWEIPENLTGRTLTLEVAVTTSIRPCIGDEKAPDACFSHGLWTKSTMGTQVGLIRAGAFSIDN